MRQGHCPHGHPTVTTPVDDMPGWVHEVAQKCDLCTDKWASAPLLPQPPSRATQFLERAKGARASLESQGFPLEALADLDKMLENHVKRIEAEEREAVEKAAAAIKKARKEMGVQPLTNIVLGPKVSAALLCGRLFNLPYSGQEHCNLGMGHQGDCAFVADEFIGAKSLEAVLAGKAVSGPPVAAAPQDSSDPGNRVFEERDAYKEFVCEVAALGASEACCRESCLSCRASKLLKRFRP